MTTYYDASNHISSYKMGLDLAHLINTKMKPNNQLIILCIGSDRSTGDSLGPLVGHKLCKCNIQNATVFGTLQNPVHAANLQNVTDYIYDNFDNPFILAIDASLGTRSHVGYYTLGQGPLIPGLGVNRSLPAIGNIHITGIVNYSGLFDNMLLQTTRLATVMTLADTISTGIIIGIRHCNYAKVENYA